MSENSYIHPEEYSDVDPSEGPPIERLESFSLAELQEMDLPAPKFIVERMLPAGVAILSAPPKAGKSWMSIDLALSVAGGRPFLGRATSKADVLYLALEDSKRRVRSRAMKVLGDDPIPEGFRVAIEADRLDTGLLARLEQEKKERPNLGLVIVDTFQKIRPAKGGAARSDYEQDYKVLGDVVKFARQYDDLAVLLIHHNRKASPEDSDPFDSILGGVALQGAVDTMLVLKYPRKRDAQKILYTVGRDISGEELVLDFDVESCRWSIEGTTDEVENRKTKAEYNESPIIRTLKHKLQEAQENEIKEYIARPTDFLQDVQEYTGELNGISASRFQAMVDKYDTLLEFDGIKHERAVQSTKWMGRSGMFHRYYFKRTKKEVSEFSEAGNY